MDFSPRSNVYARWFVVAVPLLAMTASAQEIKYGPDPDARKNMTLLLKDWEPKSMLHSETHERPRAKFYVIDVHNHVGTDAEPRPEKYANYFRWLESDDEYFPYWDYPGQGRWEIYGMALPDSVLEKVYHANAEKIFAQFDGGK